MQRCSGCGGNVSDNASFCGHCGRAGSVVTERPTSISHFPNTALATNAPTAISGPFTTAGTHEEQVYLDAVNQYRRFEQGQAQETWLPDNEDQQRRDWLLRHSAIGRLPSHRQPSAGNVPTAQRTPQGSGEPMMQATPIAQTGLNAPNNVPISTWVPSVPQEPHWRNVEPINVPMSIWAPSAPNNAPSSIWSREPENISSPPPPLPQQVPHQLKRRRYFQRPFRKAVILSVTTILVVATFIVGLFLFLSPTLSVSGSGSGGTVTISGTSLHIYGYRFFPLTSVSLTLDQGLALSTSGAVAVGITGNFEVTTALNKPLSLGLHTIHAKQSLTSQTTDLSFQVFPRPTPMLVVRQIHLVAGSPDCPAVTGSPNIIRGWACAVMLSTDSGALNWSASSTDATSKFSPSQGVVLPGTPKVVTIFIANQPSCSNATFAFVGPGNAIFVSWSCPAH